MALDAAKLAALLARAIHPGTPIEEARTCAVIYCKAIGEKPPEPQPKVNPFASKRPAYDENDSPIWIRAKYAGRCKFCGVTIDVGSDMLWKRGHGGLCRSCGQAEQRGE